jgi:hypothetical protein
MQLIKFNHRYDFGHEFYVQILSAGKHFPKPFKNSTFFQFSVSWNDYPGWPYLQITFGSNGIFSFLFWAYKFGFDFDLFARTWNFDYLREVDDAR